MALHSLLIRVQLSCCNKEAFNYSGSNKSSDKLRAYARDFPDGPVAKTPCSQCRGPGFNPWSGNYIPLATTKSSHAATKTQRSQINK